MSDSDPAKTAESLCLRYLSQREYSRAELLRKLKAKGYDESIAQATIRSLEKDGLQSDARFADALIRSRMAKGYGAIRIRQELRVRGVGDQNLDAQLRQYDWDGVLTGVYTKKYGSSAPETAGEFAARLRFLIQRGFSQSQIQSLFRRLRRSDE